MTTAVILQSAYLPWKGYFHLLHSADVFIFHDDLQYTHSDWRSRNRIMTPEGPRWLSVPAGRDERRRICDVEVKDPSWKARHRKMIEQHYRKAPSFGQYASLLEFLYDNPITNLSEFNQRAIRHIAGLLGIDLVRYDDSRRLAPRGHKTERLIDLLVKCGATRYLSGPAGRNYLDERQFVEAGVELSYFEYPDYPVYPQRFGPFTHQVSILDLLFNVGGQAPRYIWG